nr:RidA family protein [Streptomyces sp. SID10853]
MAEGELILPAAPAPSGRYRPARRTGAFLDISGQVPHRDGVLTRTGRVGEDIHTDEAIALAQLSCLNALAVARAENGTLDGVFVHRVRVFVACTPDYDEQHLVANGASELLLAVFGDAGEHARTAIGVCALPLGAPVEVEITLALDEVSAAEGAAAL